MRGTARVLAALLPRARARGGSEHYTRDPGPEIRKQEATGDIVFHILCLDFVEEAVSGSGSLSWCLVTSNLRTKIVDFRGFDSNTILIQRGGIPRPMGNFPEGLSQAMLLRIFLVGRLGVYLALSNMNQLNSKNTYH